MERSLADFIEECRTTIRKEQYKFLHDAALIALLGDAILCALELADTHAALERLHAQVENNHEQMLGKECY